MKGIIFKTPSISDCDLCCWYGTEEEHNCEHCIIASRFDTNESCACDPSRFEEEPKWNVMLVCDGCTSEDALTTKEVVELIKEEKENPYCLQIVISK